MRETRSAILDAILEFPMSFCKFGLIFCCFVFRVFFVLVFARVRARVCLNVNGCDSQKALNQIFVCKKDLIGKRPLDR